MVMAGKLYFFDLQSYSEQVRLVCNVFYLFEMWSEGTDHFYQCWNGTLIN
jgi:hypothetical protein